MNEIEYLTIPEHQCARIKPLWTALRTHIKTKNSRFSKHMQIQSFEERMDEIRNRSEMGDIRIEIARDSARGTDIGYCIASISGDNSGELDSLFITDSYQKRGIGIELGIHAINWMNCHGVEKKRIWVTYGNEEVLGFYEHLGFFPRYYILEECWR